MTPILYLCGPINGCTDAEANDWRSFVKEKLAGDYEFRDPMRRDYRGKEMETGIDDAIVAGDLADVDAVDVVFANCPKPSYGTAMEIFYAAHDLGKPVITIVPPGPVSPWLKKHSSFMAENLMAGVTYARTIRKRLK